jgi:hypothetical protein
VKSFRLTLLAGTLSLALASCNLGSNAPQNQSAMSTAAAKTVEAVLTSAAAVDATGTAAAASAPQPLPTATSTPSECQELAQITTWTRDGATYDAKEVEKKLAPGSGFVMSLIIKNTGACDWTDAYKLKFESGERVTEQELLPVMPFGYTVRPGESLTITVQMTAPADPGDYQSSYSLIDIKGKDVITFGVITKVGTNSSGTLPPPGELRYAYDCSSGSISITLTWLDKASGEEGYRVYRDGNKLADLAPDTLTYSDIVPASGAYKYTVSTFDSSGESPASVNAQTTNCQ